VGAEHRERLLKTILFLISLSIIGIAVAYVASDPVTWTLQVLSFLSASYIGIYAADHLNKRAEERARDLFSGFATDSVRKIIGDAVANLAIPRGLEDPYPANMKLFIYYVSGTHEKPRYWQISAVTISCRMAAKTWGGVSIIQNGEDDDFPYKMEIRTAKDMLVITSSQDREIERSAVYVFDSKTPDKTFVGILSHIDWRNEARLDPAILVMDHPFRFRNGSDPAVSQRIEDEMMIAELDDYYRKNLKVIGQIDCCFSSLPTSRSPRRAR
jgi:hypothetical protein